MNVTFVLRSICLLIWLVTVQSVVLRQHSASEPEKQDEKYDQALYDENWHNEYEHGDFPRYEETYNQGKLAKKHEDSQSDGKPSPGLTGKDVGAYIPAEMPKEPEHLDYR